MRKLFIFCLVLFPLLTFAEDKIKIGVSVPLSGEAATYGIDIKNGLVFANKHIADHKYELLIEDDQCSDRHAVSVAQKLVNIDKVKYVLGFGCSGALLAAAPVYDKAKVIAIASATGAPAITHSGDYIFRTIPSLNVAAEKLYKHAASKYKKVGVISEETAYCQGLTKAFIERNSENQLRIINENFLPGTTDFRTILVKFQHRGVEAIFVNPQTEAGLISIFKQIKSLNWKVALYGTYFPGSPAFLDVFGKEADGVVYADLPFTEDLLNAKGRQIFKAYLDSFGPPQSGDFNITLSYAAFNALHEAISKGKDVKSYLYGNSFSGIIDKYAFDENGDVVSEQITFVLKTIKDGRAVPMTMK